MNSDDIQPATEADSRTTTETSKADSHDATADSDVDAVAGVRSSAHNPAALWRRLRRSSHGRAGVIAWRSALAVLLGVSVASSVFWFVQNKNSEDLLAAHEEARTAACRYAPILANYDSKNLDAYFAAVRDGATGDWKKQFESTSTELREVLGQGQVTSAARDVQCAIRTGDEHSAEAIVVIGQTITSLGTQGKPAPGQLSMVMRLEKSGDRWLVNKVNSPLAQPPRP